MSYRFDTFIFDRERGLFNNSAPVPLEPQGLDLLAYLLENRDRVVSRDELNEEIWDGRVVSEAALSTCVRAVRRALGDDRTQQKYIRTHPKRGLRFVAPVESLTENDAVDVPAGEARPHKRPLIPVLAAVVAVVILGVLGSWWIARENRPAFGPLPKLSIAVLPFDNLSGDRGQDYFADAVTEDLITDLSRIRDAFVIARRTSFTYKGKTTDIRKVAEELGVRYVLEGSVRRSGDQVRVNVQLIDGETNRHIWSERYDRQLTNAFSVQSEVTGQIASVLKAELRQADRERQGPPDSLVAWDYALRGNVLLFNPKSLDDFREAKALLDTAIDLDPDIASAWSGLAFVHFAGSTSSIPGVSAPNSAVLSLEAAQRSVTIDPKNAEGHWMIGVGYARNGQTALAWASCETAIDLNPNNDCSHVCAGLTKMAMGKPTEAIPYFQQSLRLNPRFRPFTKYKYMGLAYVQSGQHTEAIEVLSRALVESPNDPFTHFVLTSALALAGRLDQARSALDDFLTVTDSEQPTIATLRERHSWMGPEFERVLEGLRLSGLPEY
jgi:TolB-like protein/DNA-binding winged helix-turn-helix (wHTH) protein/Tfp pilus assembly protein PilF